MKALFQNKDFLFYLMLVFALTIIRTPYIGKYFRVFNTLIHENAHALMALFLNGSLKKMELFNDLSGSATTATKSKFASILVSLVGYPASSFFALLMLFLIQKQYYVELLLGIIILSTFSLIFFVRNKFGILWLLLFISLTGFIYYLHLDSLTLLFLLFLSFIVLCESSISAVELFVICIKDASKAGDATNLKKTTHIPAIFWSLFFLFSAGYALFLCVTNYFPYLNTL